MKPRTLLPIVSVLALIAIVAVFMANNVTTVSAKQVLDRATAAQAQSAQSAGQGILHSRLETFENPQAIEGAGTKKVSEQFYGPKGYYRYVIQDAAGKIIEVSSRDGDTVYASQPASEGQSVLTVERKLESLPSEKLKGAAPVDQNQSLFDQFRSNPRVRVAGVETWQDGRKVYVLIDDNYQSKKLPDGQVDKTFTGTVKMVFDTQTYQLVETDISVRKDGKDIVINSYKFLVDEVLPAGTPVAWDLSDLKGLSIVDAPKVEQPKEENVEFKPLTVKELTDHTQTYLLKTIPAGYKLEIVAVNDQPKDQPFSYEIHYKNADGASFEMMAIGLTDEAFIKSNFYDGSYKAASGLVMYYSTGSGHSTSGILTTPEGNSFLAGGEKLSREQIQSMVDDLVSVPYTGPSK